MILLSVLPLRIAARVGEHPDLEALGELLTLASDKWGLYAVLDVSEGDKIRHYSCLYSHIYLQMSFPIVLPFSRFSFLMLGSLRDRVLENLPN